MKHQNIFLLLTITLLGTLLRLYKIISQSLWFDELGEYYASSQQSFSQMLPIIISHLSPPFDYVILFLTLKITPHTDFYIRLPSLIWGILSIPAIYLLSESLFKSKKVSLLSAFLLSISPLAIQYSQEARMYSLFLFLTILSYYFFFGLNPTTKILSKNYFLWILIGILLIYTHYYAVFIFLTQFIITILLTKNKNHIQKIVIGFLIILIFFSRWLPIFFHQAIGTPSMWQNLSITNDSKYFYNPIPLLSGIQNPIISLFIIILIILIVYESNKTEKITQYKLILSFALPILIIFTAALLTSSPVTNIRYFVFTIPFLLILLSFTIVTDANKPDIVLIVAIILVALLTIPSLSQYYTSQKEDWKGAGEYLNLNANINDSIVVIGGFPEYLQHYTTKNLTYLPYPYSYNTTWYLVSTWSGLYKLDSPTYNNYTISYVNQTEIIKNLEQQNWNKTYFYWFNLYKNNTDTS